MPALRECQPEVSDFIHGFVVRACELLKARAGLLAIARGRSLEIVVLHEADRLFDADQTRKLANTLADSTAMMSERFAFRPAEDVVGPMLAASLGWNDFTLSRLYGSDHLPIGLLALAGRGAPPDEADQHLLHGLCLQAAMALENTRLIASLDTQTRQWSEVVDVLEDFLVIHDDGYKVVHVNRSMAEFSGIPAKELIGVTMRALAALAAEPDARPCPFCRAGKGPRDEYTHQVLDRVYTVTTAQMQPRQTVHVLKDITDRRDAERRYRELCDNVQEGIFSASPEGRVIEVNDALLKILGYASRDALLQIDIPTQLCVSAEDWKLFTDLLDQKSVVRNYQQNLRRQNGTHVRTRQNAFAVRDAAGRVVQYRVMLLEISALALVTGAGGTS